MERVDEDYHCNAFLCRGYQYEDNTDKVLAFAPGDELDIHIDIIAGHKPGYAVGKHGTKLFSFEDRLG